jgi:hypothetical protein
MADRLRQLCQFIIGVRTLKTLKVCLRLRFGRRAADGIWRCGFIYSHSTINDITAPDCRQALSHTLAVEIRNRYCLFGTGLTVYRNPGAGETGAHRFTSSSV